MVETSPTLTLLDSFLVSVNRLLDSNGPLIEFLLSSLLLKSFCDHVVYIQHLTVQHVWTPYMTPHKVIQMCDFCKVQGKFFGPPRECRFQVSGIHKVSTMQEIVAKFQRVLQGLLEHCIFSVAHTIHVSRCHLIVHKKFQNVLFLNMCSMLTHGLLFIHYVIHVQAFRSLHNVVGTVKFCTKE